MVYSEEDWDCEWIIYFCGMKKLKCGMKKLKCEGWHACDKQVKTYRLEHGMTYRLRNMGLTKWEAVSI